MTPKADDTSCVPRSVDRFSSDSLKWSHYQDTDTLPMWVADMDYRSAEPIIQALQKRICQGVFGYAVAPKETTRAIVDWLGSRHHWNIRPEWIVWTPGLVSALNVTCRAFASPTDQVLTLTPIYPPFMAAPKLSNRNLLTCPLKNTDGFYTIDFDKLESVVSEKTRILLFCNPHNPAGRVWEKETIYKLATFCLEHNILLCSDEIHCDLIIDKTAKHIPTATLSNEIAGNTITLMSPAKTFNLPGLNCGFAIIPNEQLRRRYKETACDIVPHVNALGYTACRAAYTQGLPWLNKVLDYLRQNHQILYDAINNISGLSINAVQATYLAWIDTRQLDLVNPGAFFKRAGIAVIDGSKFGEPGFVRLNFACSQENIQLATKRIRNAVENE